MRWRSSRPADQHAETDVETQPSKVNPAVFSSASTEVCHVIDTAKSCSESDYSSSESRSEKQVDTIIDYQVDDTSMQDVEVPSNLIDATVSFRKRWGFTAARSEMMDSQQLTDVSNPAVLEDPRRTYWPAAVDRALNAEAKSSPDALAFPNQKHSHGTSSNISSKLSKPSEGTSKITASQRDSLAPHTPNPRNLRRARRRAEARGEVCGSSSEPGGCVVLIREDCRLHDNPALYFAAEKHPWIVMLYVHDDADPSPWPVRGAGLWWRHESLQYFDKSLRKLGTQILYRRGYYVEQVLDVLLDTSATALYFNRQLEPWHIIRDKELEQAASELRVEVRTFKAMVVAFEPWDVKSKDKKKEPLEEPLPFVTRKLAIPPSGLPVSLSLEDLGYYRTAGRKIPPGFRQFNEKRQQLLEHGIATPKVDDWAFEMRQFWGIGEHAAMERLEEWLKEAAWGCYFPPDLNPRDSSGGRFRADKKWTAIISPYIRFGDLSPRYVNMRCRQVLSFDLRRLFLKRVVWRDKAYAQLYRWPDSHSVSIRGMYEFETWSGTRLALRRWQRGETGFPLVDAAMRQLWKVGWMCNHLRHVTAQFLIEHLDLNWKDGFAWYDYTLVDTDVAINAMMWQMGGHSGIGAWNFVMHPVFAGKKVDPDGHFVRRWLPELAHLPVEYIHCPWEAPVSLCIAANVLVNGVYWQRLIDDLIQARKTHQANVIAVRKKFPQFVDKDGCELLPIGEGKVIKLEVRDDIRENDEDKLSLMMTADDPRSSQRRNLKSVKGVHGGLIYDETKRFEAMYDSFGGDF